MTAHSGTHYVAERVRIDRETRNARPVTVLCVLPARIGSHRIPQKPLQVIAGRSLIEWSWRAASSMSCVDRVVVATDSDEIATTVAGFGGEVCMTSAGHQSGTDRVAEVVGGSHGAGADIVVNFQPDEPFLVESSVEQAVKAVSAGEDVATLATPIVSLEELMSESVVKVVRDSHGRALYFSRSPIPASRGGWPELPSPSDMWLRHIGLYVYAKPALERWVAMPVSQLEETERLEQLRALAGGIGIHVSVVESPEPGIDTPEDLDRAQHLLSKGSHV